MKSKMALVIGTMVALVMYVGYVRTDAQTRVEFLVDPGAVVVVSGDSGDVVIVTGRSLGVRTLPPACNPFWPEEQHHSVQFGLAVDPGWAGAVLEFSTWCSAGHSFLPSFGFSS